jgi:hypothetical protein
MSDLHIDDFYHDAGLILARLYAVFPRKTTLYVEDISGPDTPDEFGLHSERFAGCFSTMLWLADTGYLRHDSAIRQEALDQAVLTERGFLLLCAPCPLPSKVPFDASTPPSVIASAQTNIQQLRTALKGRSSIEVGQIMLFLLDHSRTYR